MWPLIQRELRVESRRKLNGWLRATGAAVVLLALFLALGDDPAASARSGRGVFHGLNLLIALLIWLVAPVMTADCLSREKREGTLPLLFLTPLRPIDVVLAKCSIHFIRAASLLIAACPVLMIPVMLGGVTWLDTTRLLLLHLAALALALTAGLVASALCREWLWARVMSVALTVGGAITFLAMHHAAMATWQWMGPAVRGQSATPWARHFAAQVRWFYDRHVYMAQSNGFWRDSLGGVTRPSGLLLAAVVLLAGLALTALAVGFATRTVRRNWRRDPASLEPGRLHLLLANPRGAVASLAKQRSRLLDHNPAAWLHASTFGARLARWGWVLLLVPLAVAGVDRGTASWSLASIVMVVGVGFAAVGSFRRELESGALELLLVTPLTPRQLVLGRLRGLFAQFLPAFVALFVVGQVVRILSGSTSPADELSLMIEQFSLATLMTVMALVGIAFSLSGLPFTPSLVMAYLLVLVLPQALGNVAGQFLHVGGDVSFRVSVLYWISQAINTRLAWVFARRQLAERRFALHRESAVVLDTPAVSADPV